MFDQQQRSKRHLRKTEKNATSSPLLRLPPEIRNRIWHFALRNQVIHLYGGSPPRPCHSSATVMRAAAAIDHTVVELVESFADEFHDDLRHHRRCKSHINHSTISLTALLVCTQIYEEAALIPFASNTFYFANWYAMNNLVVKLTATQRNAINTITVQVLLAPYFEPNAISPYRFRYLTGLKSITIFQDMLASWIPYKQYEMVDLDGYPDFSYSRSHLERLPLVSIHLHVYVITGYDAVMVSVDDQQSVIRWATAVRDRLLRPWDQEAFDKYWKERRDRESATARREHGLRTLERRQYPS